MERSTIWWIRMEFRGGVKQDIWCSNGFLFAKDARDWRSLNHIELCLRKQVSFFFFMLQWYHSPPPGFPPYYYDSIVHLVTDSERETGLAFIFVVLINHQSLQFLQHLHNYDLDYTCVCSVILCVSNNVLLFLHDFSLLTSLWLSEMIRLMSVIIEKLISNVITVF